MDKFSVYIIVYLMVTYDQVPRRALSVPLIRYLRSPNTTPESHISNFLHQHRADSRADKPIEHPTNLSDTMYHSPRPRTTTEAPISQTELLVNLIHNTIQTVRDQFPALISAISNPGDSKKTNENSKNLKAIHSTNTHFMQERSTNETLEENVTESDERTVENEESGEDDGDREEYDENNEHDFSKENAPVALIPPALIRTIVETSASSSARGSADASAGSAASTSASASSSSSSGGGRNTRQVENEGSGSAEFLGAIVRHKVQALAALILSPILSTSAFIQRSVGYASGSSSGSSIPENSALSPHRDYVHHGYRNGESIEHHSQSSYMPHHSDNHHHSEEDNYHSAERGHHTQSHGHHSENHGHHLHETHLHSSHHSEKHDNVPDQRTLHHQDAMKNESANFVLEGYESSLPHVVHFRDTANNFKANVTDNFQSEEIFTSAGPIRVTFQKNGLEETDNDRQTILVRKSREARMLLNERLGIYILEIFGSIAGLMWGAFHQITHLFQGRSDDQGNSF